MEKVKKASKKTTKRKQIKKKTWKEKIMKKLGIKSKSAFTLIELLAVIVILGLLMAIAIPSVTKYITQSRKKTVTSTIGNYIGALVNDVNDLSYTFTETNTVYAVPIECIALERGGTNPFGAWHQANDAYWAYVLVQYNDETSSYTYGYTFKDSAGYGLYPTAQSKLNEQGKQIQTGLKLNRPKNGTVTDITDTNNWNGFVVNNSTNLVVLEAASEGNVGDGKSTCTLQQKGDNYASVEEEKIKNDKKLVTLIKTNNPIIKKVPTLTTSTKNSSDEVGLYVSTDTNSGNPTYYFRGKPDNYVRFAGLLWKIVRINEDGSVRLTLHYKMGDTTYKFASSNRNLNNMYYSESDIAKPTLDAWYQTNIIDKGLDSYVVTGTFCEEAKVIPSTSFEAGEATLEKYDTYQPTFKCGTDKNGKGIVKSKIGMLSYDEVIFAGGYYGEQNSTYYLNTSSYAYWTMSPSGTYAAGAFYSTSSLWYVTTVGDVNYGWADGTKQLRPVINLAPDVMVSGGDGSFGTPFFIQTN